MNFKNSKKSNFHRLVLNITDKIDLKKSDKYVALSNLSVYLIYMEKHKKVIQTQ